jgi:hypothetical protein
MSIRSVRKVIQYLESRKVSVRKGRDNVYYPEEKVIIYNASGGPKTQLYTLLHEAGHFLQEKSRNFTVHNLIYQDEIYTKYQKYRLLEQEMDAWNRGLQLAHKLGIKIDEIDYRKTAAYYVMFYVKSIAHDS